MVATTIKSASSYISCRVGFGGPNSDDIAGSGKNEKNAGSISRVLRSLRIGSQNYTTNILRRSQILFCSGAEIANRNRPEMIDDNGGFRSLIYQLSAMRYSD